MGKIWVCLPQTPYWSALCLGAMRGAIPSIVFLVLIALVFPVSFSTAQDDDPTRASWAAPPDHTGDIVIRFTIDFGEENHCESVFEAASDNPEGGVRYRSQGAHFGTTGWQSQPVTLHSGEVDSREVVSLGGGGGLRVTSVGPLSGVHNVSMTIFNAYAIDPESDDPWGPLRWSVDCDNEVEVTDKAGGFEALGFTQRTLDGDGASANAFLAAASVNLDGHAGATFTDPDVTFDWFSYGNLAGNLTLEAPDIGRSWDLEQSTGGGHSGGAGEYAVTLDRTGAGMFDDLVGVISASHPVDEFDDLFGSD